MIDLLICACRRAQVLERTLDTFHAHLFSAARSQVWAHINIDPVGPDPDDQPVLTAVRKQYDLWAYRTPQQAGFPMAFKWLWSQSKGLFAFWLEDDWELLHKIDLARMIDIMDRHPDLAVLRLPWIPSGVDGMKNWRFHFPWNGEFFECPTELRREVGFCGHPSLIRGDFVRRCATLVDATKNPEKQFHYLPGLVSEVERWRFGVFGALNAPLSVRDIGREWMVQAGYRKAGNKAFFTHWEEV